MNLPYLGSSKVLDDEASSEPGGALLGSSADRNAGIGENDFIKLNTHDVSFVEEHIPSIEKFADDLQIAINAAWLTRKKNNYEDVHVLLLSLEDDNLGVEQEIKRLRHVFACLYRFDVREYQIPRKKPGKAAISRVSPFLGLDDHGTLLIVYYAGRARLSRRTNEPPIWAA
jgi:hypothetical protein